MEFKKLFMNKKAVSPVIGVILMVAITVILAAAIGSAVFGQGTAQSAPRANLNIQGAGITASPTTPDTMGTIKIEHLGGDPINFDTKVTKIMVSVNGGNSEEVSPTASSALGTLDAGDARKLDLIDSADVIPINYGDIVNIKIIDKATNQLICNKDISF